MIEQLFGSKTRVKLLHMFYTNPNRSFYVREITRKVGEQINSVRRELGNLQQIGIIKSDTSGNKLYYEVNQGFKHYEPMRKIFTDLNTSREKSIKEENDLAYRIRELGAIHLALLSGIFVRERSAPVDMLIVGDVNRNKLEKLMNELEEEEGESIRYTVLSKEDYEYRLDLNDRFLTLVLESKHTVVIDNLSKLDEASAPKKKTSAKK